MPNKADVKAWKAQLVAQAEQQILKLTDSDQFKKYLNTLAKFHHYSVRNIDLSNGKQILTAPLIRALNPFELRHRLLRN